MSIPPVNYPLSCSYENCNAFLRDSNHASKHRHEYHTAPGPVVIGGTMYNVVWEGKRIRCPVEGCKCSYTTRSSFKKHVDSPIHAQSPSPSQGEVDAVTDTGTSTTAGRDEKASAGSAHAFEPLHQEHNTQQAISVPPATILLEQEKRAHRVTLDAGEDYISCSALLDSVGICMHTALRIFICRSCSKCLTADMVAGHRKEKHKQSLTTLQLSSLANYVEEHKIFRRQEQVIIPASGGPPVQLIGPPRNALLCQSSQDCVYAVCDKATMQKHAKNVHPQISKDPPLCKEIQVQQLFDSVGRAYFVVDPNASHQNKDLEKVLNDTFSPSLYVPLVQTSLSPEERRPLIKAMSWDIFMPDLRSDPAQVKAIQMLKEKHSPAECHDIFSALKDLMQAHMDMAATILEGNPHKLTLAKALLHGSQVTDKSDYWAPISDKNTSYCDMIFQLLRAIVRLRVQMDHPSKFSFQLDPAQEHALVALLAHMNFSNNALDETAITMLHEFLWSLINADSFHKGEPWANVIQRFIWLKALRRDGNFYEVTDYTPDLAKLKYFLNSTCLLHALWYQRESELDELERVIAVHEEVLRVGRLTTFNMVHEYQQYASALAFGQKREPKVYIDPEFAWLSIGTETMHISKFRQGIQTLLKQVEEGYLKLTHGRIMLEVMPNCIHDDMTNSTRGHSFAMHESFHPLKLKLFCHLVEKHRLAMVDRSGVLSWDIPAVKDILRQSGEVWKPLYHLLYVTPQISTRSVQFLQHHISNADRHRNIFVEAQEVFFLSGYSKTTHITDRDSCTPSYVNPKVARWLVEFLAGGLREAESILAKVAYGNSAQHDYKTFLVMDNGSRMSPDQWYAVFQQRNREVFQCAWGVRDFRQGAIAMAREFISPSHAFSLADDLLAEGADHSTEIDHSHYGNLRGSIPELSNNAVEKHRWLAREWHSFCGLGPFEPQEPVRRTRMRGGSAQAQSDLASSSPHPSSIASLVSASCSKLVKDFLLENLPGLLKDVLTEGVIPQIVSALHSHVEGVCHVMQNVSPVPDISGAAFHIGQSNITEGSRSFVSTSKKLHPHINSEANQQFVDTDKRDDEDQISQQQHPYIASEENQQFVDLDETDDEDQNQHKVQQGYMRIEDRKRPRNCPTTQSDCSDDFQPLKRIRLEKSYEDGEEDVSMGTAEMSDVEEGNTHNAPSTAFLEEDFSLSDQDDDESRVLAALENEEEDDIMVESDPVFDSDPISEGIDDTLLTQVMQGDMRQHLSPSKIDSWTKKVRAAFQVLFKDPAAKEKSPEQLNAIVMLMAAKKDAMITLKTGGGKSALWMIAPLIHPYPRCIVICPFVALLEEQVERCLSAGLRAHNFTKDKNVPDDVQLLFIQVESCSSKAFKDLMHAQEHRYHRIFIDENHDSLICHPERKEPWKKLARHLSILRMPLNFLSGTNPPSNVAASLKIFGLKPKDVIQIRSCTDRPEIGFHVVKILPHAYDLSLKHIVFALLSTMTKSDRMLVFFNRNKEADEFSTSIGCAVFHSELPTLGNTKGLNLERWDTGETQVMACTTAFAQGVDRSSVRYVVISEVEYGLMVVNQMSGRAGRDGREAHTFYLTRKTTLSAFDSDQDYDCLKGLDDVLFGHTCRRYTSIRCMDGEQHAYRCKERSDVMQCDVCDPRSHMELFVAKAIRDPFRPTSDHPAESRGNILVPSSSQQCASPATSIGNIVVPSTCRMPTPDVSISSPETEEDFFAQLPDITPEMTRAIDTFEASDTTRSPSSKKALLRKDRAAKFLSSQPSSSSVGSTTASEHPASKKDRSHRSSYPTLSKTSTASAPAASRSTESKQDRRLVPIRASTSKSAKPHAFMCPPASLPAASKSARSTIPHTRSPSTASQQQPSWVNRGNKVREALEKRLQSTSLLDKYMRKLKGRCPFHFVNAAGRDRFHPEHDFACHHKGRAWDAAFYETFRRCFVFGNYTYCFKCALPQNNNHNNEAPSCHSGVGYSKGDKCPFAGFIFKAVFFLWKTGRAEKLARQHLGASTWTTKEEFIHWVQKEHSEKGRYVNLVELFLAFCKKLEKAQPDIFN